MSATEQSLREAIEAAYDEHEQPDTAGSTGESDQSADAAPAGNGAIESAGVSDDTAEPVSESDAASVSEATSTEETSADASADTSADEKPSGLTFEPVEAEDEAKSDPKPRSLERAPGDWKPAAREHWDALPDAVKVEVRRQTQQIGQALRETKAARDFKQDFDQMVAPFQPMMAANNADPLATTRGLLQTQAALHGGTPQQKAHVVAQIINTYSVDVNTLDDILVNGQGAAEPANQQLLQQINQQLAPINRFMGEVEATRAAREQQTNQSLEREWSEFTANNEFAEDLRESMADLMELADKRGQRMTFKDAYEKAILLDPEIQRIVTQRRAAEAAQADQATLARKKRAAASPTSQQAGVAVKRPANLREAIEAAWDAHENGMNG